MTYIQVNIGRNIDNEPMGGIAWGVFQGRVKRAICGTIIGDGLMEAWMDLHRSIEVHTGTGTWDGIVEESAKISVFWPGDVAEVDLDYLRSQLRELKRDYRQDAIALITDSELV